MSGRSVKIVSFAAAALLVLAAGLSAKAKSGSQLVISKVDGSRVSGELIAVKPDSLLVLGPEGRDVSVPRAEIRIVRLVRRSHALVFALSGLVPGAVAGAMLGSDPDIRSGELTFGALLAGAGALAGLTLSQILATDVTFPVAGESDEAVGENWERLRSYSREGRRARRPGPAAARVPPGEAARLAPSAALGRGSRILVRVSGWGRPAARAPLPDGEGSFRLPDEALAEQGPFPVIFFRSHSVNSLSGLSLGLAYEWRDHLLAEVELFDLGSSTNNLGGELRYASAAEGAAYACGFFRQFRARLTGLSAGLTYRTAVPKPFRRHILEFGAAAGPALIRGLSAPMYAGGDASIGVANPVGGRVVFTARASAAYDYYLYPGVSIGAVAGFRFMETELSGRVSAGDEFFDREGDDDPSLSRRRTEVSFPSLLVKMSGLFGGLRVTFKI